MDFQQRLQLLSIQFVPFVMAVVFHEFAHGFVAKRFGDKTAYDAGRMTLNPLPHIDPLGTVILPLISMLSGANVLFGWARPVPINPTRFKKYKPGLFWVSFAGPLMNFTLAIVSAIVFCIFQKFVPHDFFLFEPFIGMTYVSVSLNFALGIFNLVPIPPLDGSRMIEVFLSYEMSKKYEALAQYSFYIIMALMFTGAFSVLAIPIRILTQLTLYFFATLFGVGGI